MSTPLQRRHALGAEVEVAFATLAGESWVAHRAGELGDGSVVLRREERADGSVVVAVSRELPSGVPGFLQRFLPADGRVQQTETWAPSGDDGVRRGTWQVEVAGAPAEMGGTMRLEPDGSGCAYVIEGTVTVRLPLVGGKAESFLVDMVQQLSDKEATILRAALAE
ncbi:MAG TPA: DUF2505 domain-containing protein [Mycobacteriales bacterium]|nr:DUF2505 domain-containing protein [Mycobacteriales bacterium]